MTTATTAATMTAEDRAYAWQHAASWAQGSRLGSYTSEATAYADWYSREYVTDAGSLADLPAHTHAWPRYLDSKAPTCPMCGSHDLTEPHWNGYVTDATECRNCGSRMTTEGATPGTEVHEFIKANHTPA